MEPNLPASLLAPPDPVNPEEGNPLGESLIDPPSIQGEQPKPTAAQARRAARQAAIAGQSPATGDAKATGKAMPVTAGKRYKVSLPGVPEAEVEAPDSYEAYQEYKRVQGIVNTIHEPIIREIQ
jgi:hypothetical protein